MIPAIAPTCGDQQGNQHPGPFPPLGRQAFGGTTVALWVLAYFPNGGTGLEGSYAGMIGRVIEPIFKPIGFNLEMVVALIPGMAAREAAVSSLGLIYSCLLYTSPSPRDRTRSRMPSSA